MSRFIATQLDLSRLPSRPFTGAWIETTSKKRHLKTQPW